LIPSEVDIYIKTSSIKTFLSSGQSYVI